MRFSLALTIIGAINILLGITIYVGTESNVSGIFFKIFFCIILITMLKFNEIKSQ